MVIVSHGALCLLFLVACLQRGAEGGQLLVVPVDGSHWLNLKALMDELGKRGHDVVVVIPEISMNMGPSPHYTTKVFPVPYSRELMESIKPTIVTNSSFFQEIGDIFRKAGSLRDFFLTTCESLLYNSELMSELAERNFSAVLTDPFVPCGAIVAEFLSLPTVNLLRGIPCGLDYSATQCPRPLSYVPRFFTGNTDRMTFLQRIKNLLVNFLEPWLCRFLYAPFEELAIRFLKKDVTLVQLLSQTSIWLMRYDFIMEYPRPLMPNMVLVGGINCKERKPLPQELEEFVTNSGEHGVAIFTLGSMVSEIPRVIADRIADALGQIPQKVLWRYTGEIPTTLSPNTKLVKWLPQNDLLGHPKTRAFITHGGTNGIYEAICNGVPSVMLPLFGDQYYNVKHMVDRGAGISLDIKHMSSHDLVNALNAVINNTRYKETMMQLSARHKDRLVEPMNVSIHWVEFVMKHRGAEHLRPAAHDLNWIQYHCLDVVGVLLVSVVTSIYLTVQCCSLCCKRYLCGGRNLRKKKSD
ncbi:UDP-glucuronosyltransferase 1A1-like [Leucoraja erinacea]|uniref:UDP-glucuronosyltransferase 1A1-like n=1 Tax=Leucoraja erinaceus TaxID=7782 RepID=UPI0024587500|nr:UDP-glucuronosyltransferase 1A1-like [Leucoraja erinacea]XP_055494397.1 UDP-glucuronosyltransferase 1A1-like [Leucoraja erinacea]